MTILYPLVAQHCISLVGVDQPQIIKMNISQQWAIHSFMMGHPLCLNTNIALFCIVLFFYLYFITLICSFIICYLQVFLKFHFVSKGPHVNMHTAYNHWRVGILPKWILFLSNTKVRSQITVVVGIKAYIYNNLLPPNNVQLYETFNEKLYKFKRNIRE